MWNRSTAVASRRGVTFAAFDIMRQGSKRQWLLSPCLTISWFNCDDWLRCIPISSDYSLSTSFAVLLQPLGIEQTWPCICTVQGSPNTSRESAFPRLSSPWKVMLRSLQQVLLCLLWALPRYHLRLNEAQVPRTTCILLSIEETTKVFDRDVLVSHIAVRLIVFWSYLIHNLFAMQSWSRVQSLWDLRSMKKIRYEKIRSSFQNLASLPLSIFHGFKKEARLVERSRRVSDFIWHSFGTLRLAQNKLNWVCVVCVHQWKWHSAVLSWRERFLHLLDTDVANPCWNARLLHSAIRGRKLMPNQKQEKNSSFRNISWIN